MNAIVLKLRWFLFPLLFTSVVHAADHTRLDWFLDQQGIKHRIQSAEDWQHRRTQILAGMQEVMGPLPDRTHLSPLDIIVIDHKKRDGIDQITFTFVSEKFGSVEDRVPALLLIPDHPAGSKLPAMLALHETSNLGKREVIGEGKPDNAYGIELARRGYIVLCPDYPSFGNYSYDFHRGDYVSGSMKGIFNHVRCVDLLQDREDVDPERIGVIGHSLGGHNAMFAALFDPRIKAIVASCGWTPFADYQHGNLTGWTSDRYMPRIKTVYQLDPAKVPFDFYEIVAALAPRPFFSNSPLHDSNFDVAGVKNAIAAARPIYQLTGAPEAVQVCYPDAQHSFPEEIRQQAYQFLDQALKR